MNDLGREQPKLRYRFGGKPYVVGNSYPWKDLPPQVQKDLASQADEIESRYGRDPRSLQYKLVLVSHPDLIRSLQDRFGEEGFLKRLKEPKTLALARQIDQDGLQYPPVVEQGFRRAFALAYLGWDMPYFMLEEPIDMPSPEYIKTLDGRRR